MSSTPQVIWDDQPKAPPASATAQQVQWDDEQSPQIPATPAKYPGNHPLNSPLDQEVVKPAPVQLTQPSPVMPPAIAEQVRTALPNIAQYPENQQKPDPDYVQRKAAFEAVQGEPGAPQDFEYDAEQERRIKAQEQVTSSHSMVPQAAIPALVAGKKYAVDPFERASQAGAQAGRDLATRALVTPPVEIPMQDNLPPVTEQEVQERLKGVPAPVVGTARAAGSVVGGVVADPRMWPLFFAGPETSAAKTAMSVGFAGQMAAGAYEQAGELGKIMDNPDVPQEDKWEAGANMVLSTLMAAQAGGHPAIEAVKERLEEFQKLPPQDQQAIRKILREKAPEIATEVDKSAGAQPAEQAAPKVTWDDQKSAKTERFRLPRGTSAQEVQGPVKGPNIRTVQVGDKTYAFDQRKINADGVTSAVERNELWRLTGGKAPEASQVQAEQDVRGEEAQSATEQPVKEQAAPEVKWDDEGARTLANAREESRTTTEPQAPTPKPDQAMGNEAPVVPQESQTTQPDTVKLYHRTRPGREGRIDKEGLSHVEGGGELHFTDKPDAYYPESPNPLYSVTVSKADAEAAHRGGNDYTFHGRSFGPKEITKVLPHPDLVAQHEAQPERRTDLTTRKRVAEMSPEERSHELLTSELTKLPNKRAFEEDSQTLAESHPHVGYADVDDFKPFNSILGKEAVDAHVLPKIGESFQRAAAKEPGGSVKVYHRSGDEFWFRAKDKDAVRRVTERVNEELKDAVFTAESPDGTIHQKRGAGLSHGTGRDTKSAEFDAENGSHPGSKAQRKAAGLRSGARDLTGPMGEEPAQGKQAGEREVAARPEVKPTKSAVERFTESHNAGKPEEAHQSIKEMVRERLGKKEEPKAAEPGPQKGAEVSDKPFNLKPPPPDIGVKQYIASLPKEQQDYARAAWAEVLQSGAKGLHDIHPNDFGIQDVDSVEHIDQKLLAISKGGEAAGARSASERANIRRGNIQEPETKQPKREIEPPKEPAGYGSKNTVFTADKRDAALARLKAKMGRLHSGIDPEMVNDLIDIGGYHFEAGLRDFGDWAKKVVEDVGDWAKPYLKAIHEEIANTLGEGSKIKEEQGHETTQPGGSTAAPAISRTEGEGGKSSEHPSPETVRGPSENGETERPSGRQHAAGVEQPERLPGQRPANGRGGRAEPGADTAEGRGDRGTGRAGSSRKPVGADGKPIDTESPKPLAVAQIETHGREQSKNFRYENPEQVGAGGEMSKIDLNLAAIELIKQLDEEGRHATPEEQEALAKYTGWGGLSGIFNRSYERGYRERYQRLTDLVSNDELNAITKSTMNAHYTSPEVVNWMWKLADKMGFKGGRIIEPGMGVGYFFGLMPKEIAEHPDTKLLGVELDRVTGRIAQELYQGAKIINAGYETVQMPDNTLDFAIGNVPFAQFKPSDARYKKLNLSLHNYYFIKTLDKVRPGGLVSFITSRYTMDAVDPRVRKLIADRADLVAAYRFPNTAFKGVANTKVTADLLILRKRFANEARGGESFENIVPHTDNIKINQYFHDNPHNMFGVMDPEAGNSMNEPGLRPEGDLTEHLDRAMRGAPSDIYAKAAQGPDVPEFADPTLRAPDHVKEGAFYLDDKDQLKMRRQGVPVDLPPQFLGQTSGAPALRMRLRSAIDLRDKTGKLLSQMLSSSDDEPLKPLQKELSSAYDRYVKQNGYLHGKKTFDAYGQDPDYGVLLALENWDPKSSTGVKAEIFSKRTMRPYEPPTAMAEEPHSWVPSSLANKGKLDLEYIGDLTGKTPAEVGKALEERNLAFRDPDSNQFLTADEYLSGEVRDKLATAKKAAEIDPSFQRNVEALEKSQPEKVPIHQVDGNLGMHWIPREIYQDFVHDMAKTPEHARGGRNKDLRLEIGQLASGGWTLQVGDRFNTVSLDKEFAAGGRGSLDLIQDSLNGKQTNVYGRDADGNQYLDKERTLAAREAQQRIKMAFRKWMHDKVEHRDTLETLYNQAFNGLKHREFDGSHLTFPGLNPSWTLRPHQANAVWRVIQNGRALLAHEVGAGKTLEMISSGMELRRLGMSKKNMYVVPNNMIGQWANDFGRTYPGARILAAPEDSFKGPTARNEFMAKAATGDWDGIIVPHSVFDLLGVSPDVEAKYVNSQLEQMRHALQEMNDNMQEGKLKKRTIKDMEKQIAKRESRLKDLANGKKDNALPFDQLGVDTLFVDEAHAYKNLPTNSSLGAIQGLPSGASERSEKMEMKTRHILESHNGRGVVFATGTPIANSIAETYNMSRFVAPDTLEKAGIRNFDDWRATFADVQTNWEYKADGVTYKPVASLSEYVNVPEASSMFRSFADVKTAKDLNLPVPKPDRIDHTLKVTDIQDPLLQSIADRAKVLESGNFDPRQDGWLKLSGDARKISLDPRLYEESLPDHPDSKINEATKTIKKIYDDKAKEKGTQLVFSDFAQSHEKIPIGMVDGVMRFKQGKVLFDALNDLKSKLVAAGIPAREIAIAGEYGKKEMKQLQEDMRAGKIRVAMGSTAKLGVGLNVQDRLYALHHLDQPWRPADVTQREGRIMRQGNMFDQVQIHRYVSEPKTLTSPRAYDLQMFQKLERKARMIDSFMDGSIKNRRIEDVSGRAMLTPQDFALGKAAAAGNPDALKKVQLEQEIQRLNTLQRDWNSKNYNQHLQQRSEENSLLYNQGRLAPLEKLRQEFERWEQQGPDRVHAVIDGREFRTAKDNPASKQIQAYLNEKYPDPASMVGRTFHIAGIDVPVRATVQGTDVRIEYQFGGDWHKIDTGGAGLFNSVMGMVHHTPNKIAGIKAAIESIQSKIASYKAEAGGESPFEKKLEEAEIELEATNKRLGIGAVDKPPEEIGDATAAGADKEMPEEETDRSGERGSATASAMPIPALISSVAGVIKKGRDLYHGAVDKALDWAHMGQTRPEIRKIDPDAADLATKMDAGGQYHKAVAEMIGKKVTGPLAETFDKADNFASRQKKNEISRDRMKGFHFLADAQNREWLEENHPEDFHRWNADPKIKEALDAYKPFESQLRDAVKQLGGKTIDEDYIKRVMDFATSGVAYEKGLAHGVEGPVELRQGAAAGAGGGRDNVVSPQIDRSKARKDAGKFYWDHGVFDFGPSFEKRWVELQSKLDEHRLAVHSMSMGTRIMPDEAMPEKVFYNGQEFYRPDIAKEIREVQKLGVSAESKALADALGVSELPTPKEVREYANYEPLRRGSRFETAARNLAASVLAGKEGLEGQASNVNRMAKLRYALPKEIVDALNDAGREKELGAASKLAQKALGPLTQFIRQQIVGLAYGVPHMANILRKVVQATPGAALNPVAWANAFKVAFSKELKARGIAGPGDPGFDRLLRNAAINEGAVPEYKRYIEGNMDAENWAQTIGNAFRKGGKEGAKVTPLSAAAGVGRLAIEPLNRLSEAGHRNLFKPGGIDQRARLWLGDFLKDRYPGMDEQRIAHEVNQTLGRYNRASWTDVQRNLGPLMLFPGWDYSSMAFALKHPFKTAVAPAVLMLLANAAVHSIGGNKNDEKNDLERVHIGKYSVRANLFNDNMGTHMWGWALRGAKAGLDHKNAKEATGDVVKGIPSDVAGVTTGTMNPILSTPIQVGENRLRPGGGAEIAPRGDFKKKGHILPNKAAEDYADFGARRLFPIYDRATQAGQRPSLASFAGLAGVSVSEKKKKK